VSRFAPTYSSRSAAERARFVEVLRLQAKVEDQLQPPPIVRLDVPVDGAPVSGTADAPVTLVEFSDFHCPFCRQVQPVLAQLLERYPDKVRLAYRDFPLDGAHPRARRAAEAAHCAREQGNFWEYHDVLFAHPSQATPEDLKRYAAQVGLDRVRFEGCVTERVHRPAVQRDFEEGVRLGVTGMPTVFVNGRSLSGAQPL
jgi:protein-disulfide isomerase